MRPGGGTVVLGAGSIGCGFVAERVLAARQPVTLVTRTAGQAEALRVPGGAHVRLLGRRGPSDLRLAPVEAVPAADDETVVSRIAGADLVAVCVGSAPLAGLAPLLAAGLRQHRGRINVLVFDNSRGAAARLRQEVAGGARTGAGRHGYADALVERIVVRGPGGPDAGPRFLGEARTGVVVDASALRAPLPRLGGLLLVDDYEAHVLRKLYVFSAGHAAAAYLGALYGHRLLADAVADPRVRVDVLGAMAEGQAGLAARYGVRFAGGPARRLAELTRFASRELGDTVARVGREPLRKLGPQDRVVGPALAAAAAGVVPVALARVAAAALLTGDLDDGARARLHRLGAAHTLQQVARLPEGSTFGRLVADAHLRLGSRPAGVPEQRRGEHDVRTRSAAG